MKVAVTGATGYVGKQVISCLGRLPVQIIGIARNIDDRLPDIGTGTWVELDLNKLPEHSYELIGSPDYLIHLAWDGLPKYQNRRHYEVELGIQYGFLKSLICDGLPSLLVAGTCFEYGMQSGSLTEKSDAKPSNPYGFAKNALREQLEFLGDEFDFKLTWARMFYTFGAGQSGASLYSQLVSAIERGDMSFAMSGGEQIRDFLSIEDAARYLVKLAMLNCDIGVVNVCSGSPMSVLRFVQKLLDKNNWDIELEVGKYPYPDYEPMAFWGDNSYLKSLVDNVSY